MQLQGCRTGRRNGDFPSSIFQLRPSGPLHSAGFRLEWRERRLMERVAFLPPVRLAGFCQAPVPDAGSARIGVFACRACSRLASQVKDF